MYVLLVELVAIASVIINAMVSIVNEQSYNKFQSYCHSGYFELR